MFGVIGLALAFLVVKKLDKLSDYKEPKGKDKNRYK